MKTGYIPCQLPGTAESARRLGELMKNPNGSYRPFAPEISIPESMTIEEFAEANDCYIKINLDGGIAVCRRDYWPDSDVERVRYAPDDADFHSRDLWTACLDKGTAESLIC